MSRKVKVLVCAFSCIGDPDKRFAQGGEGVLGWNIVKQLSRFFKVFVLTHSQNKKFIEKEKIPNLKFFYLHFPFLNFFQKMPGGIQFYAYLWQIKAYFLAKKLHQKINFDVFHHVTYANDWMASFIGALLKIPYIRGPGGGAHKVPKSFLSEFSFKSRLAQYFRTIAQWTFRHDPFFILGQKKAKAILVCNREALEAILKNWRKKTYLFPVNGISSNDLNCFTSIKRQNNKFRVLSAGKLLSIKGFGLAIKAFKIFTDKLPEAEFTIIGNGPELKNLENLVHQLELEDKIQFKEWMVRNDFLAELSSCDVFLFPSLRDGGGAVVVEAMASGKPVVCLDIGGPGLHVTKECGIRVGAHFPEQAVRDLGAALELLFKDRELCSRMGKAGRERAERFYHWDRLCERLMEIYQEALGLDSPRPRGGKNHEGFPDFNST